MQHSFPCGWIGSLLIVRRSASPPGLFHQMNLRPHEWKTTAMEENRCRTVGPRLGSEALGLTISEHWLFIPPQYNIHLWISRVLLCVILCYAQRNALPLFFFFWLLLFLFFFLFVFVFLGMYCSFWHCESVHQTELELGILGMTKHRACIKCGLVTSYCPGGQCAVHKRNKIYSFCRDGRFTG